MKIHGAETLRDAEGREDLVTDTAGGHSISIVGCGPSEARVFQNSWSTEWGYMGRYWSRRWERARAMRNKRERKGM